MFKNWIQKHNIHHRFRVFVLLCALVGYGLSLALWWTFMNLRPFAEPSFLLTIIEFHPVTSSLTLIGASSFFPKLYTLLLITILIFPFGLLAYAIFNAYMGL